ncbi:hypothetical protein [Sphingobium sp. Cam5-1]|nr:hypothetical protein [Sphingobium sp. Cam5-1]QPI73934.1 hypothetical protein IZV00_05575 [Sphingobium sp. Cam5-1]
MIVNPIPLLFIFRIIASICALVRNFGSVFSPKAFANGGIRLERWKAA